MSLGFSSPEIVDIRLTTGPIDLISLAVQHPSWSTQSTLSVLGRRSGVTVHGHEFRSSNRRLHPRPSARACNALPSQNSLPIDGRVPPELQLPKDAKRVSLAQYLMAFGSAVTPFVALA